MADLLTWSRIVLILPISVLLAYELNTAAVGLHVLAVVSDLLDGPIARRRGEVSARGANFDGTADIALGLASAGWVYFGNPQFRRLLAAYAMLGLGLLVLYAVICILRTKRLMLLHLWSALPAAGLLYLLFPLSIFGLARPWAVHLTGAAVVLFYLESILYVVRGRTDPHGRSAFL